MGMMIPVELDWIDPKPFRLLVARVLVAAVEARSAGGVQISDGRQGGTVQAPASNGALPGAIITERVDGDGCSRECVDHLSGPRDGAARNTLVGGREVLFAQASRTPFSESNQGILAPLWYEVGITPTGNRGERETSLTSDGGRLTKARDDLCCCSHS